MIAWKDSPRRKPLILRGARQTGKSYLLSDAFATSWRDRSVSTIAHARFWERLKEYLVILMARLSVIVSKMRFMGSGGLRSLRGLSAGWRKPVLSIKFLCVNVQKFLSRHLQKEICLRNSEIEFLLSSDSGIVPAEVKSGIRTRSKSLQQFRLKYNPAQTIKISGKPLAIEGDTFVNVPLYYAGFVAGGVNGL